MKFFDFFKKKEKAQVCVQDHAEDEAHALYDQLVSLAEDSKYDFVNLDEGMGVVKAVICGYWKPRFLVDHNAKCAYEFMSSDESLCTVGVDDIDWASLEGLPEKIVDRAHCRDAHFPTSVLRYKNGVAEVCWEINPDGMYYRDEDGYGMTDDEEVDLRGSIDRKGRVVEKFRLQR